jgi:hypothetical protein
MITTTIIFFPCAVACGCEKNIWNKCTVFVYVIWSCFSLFALRTWTDGFHTHTRTLFLPILLYITYVTTHFYMLIRIHHDSISSFGSTACGAALNPLNRIVSISGYDTGRHQLWYSVNRTRRANGYGSREMWSNRRCSDFALLSWRK